MMRGPLSEFQRHQKMYEDMLRPFRQYKKFLEHPLQRELERYQEQQKWIEDRVSPLLGDINALKNVTAGLRMEPPINFLEDHQRTLRSLHAPLDLTAMVDSIARDYGRSIRMPRDIEQMLSGLARYSSASPEEPDPEVLNELREHVEELRSSSRERISDTFGALLRWLVTNASRFDKKTISFIVFTIIYPLVIAIYQPEIQKAVHPREKQEQKELERRVVRAVAERIPVAALPHLRYVSAHTLNMRSAPRRNSSRISELRFGDVVLVLNSTKDWTLVSYRVGDAEVRGWVYTRYLRRFPASG